MTAPIRPMAFDRAAAKRAGYTDDEIDRFLFDQSMDAARGQAPVSDALIDKTTRRDPSPERIAANNASWTGAARTFAKGATLNFGDEIEAGVRAPFSDQTYDELVRGIRQNTRDFRQNEGKAATLLELSGALMSGGGIAKALGAAKPAATAWEAAKTAGRAGAVMGGAAGVGSGENARERLTHGAVGAGVGGVAGMAIGAGAAKAAQVAANRSVPKEQRIIARAMEQDKLPPTALRQRLADTPIDDNLSMADIGGDATRRTAGTATLRPTESGAQLRESMLQRSLQGGDDFANLVQSETGVARENIHAAQATMKAMRQQTSGPLFEAAAKSGPVSDPRLTQILRTSPEARRAYERMMIAAQRMDLDVPPLPDMPDPAVLAKLPPAARAQVEQSFQMAPLDARAAHWLKLEMDGIKNAAVKQARTAEGGMTTTTARQISRDAKALRDVLADVIPDYGKALETYAKASGDIKAYQTALKGGKAIGNVESTPSFTRAKAEDVQALTRGMSPSERASYTRGAVQDLSRNSEDATALARRLTRLADNPTEQEKYRAIFDDPAAFDRFIRGAQTQRGMRLAEDEIIGNSKTAMRDAAREALQGDVPFLEDAAQRGVRQAGESRFWRMLQNRRMGKAAEGVAREMKPRSKAELDAQLKLLEDMLVMRMNSLPTTQGAARIGAYTGAGTNTMMRR